jgi:hypothetical protein
LEGSDELVASDIEVVEVLMVDGVLELMVVGWRVVMS